MNTLLFIAVMTLARADIQTVKPLRVYSSNAIGFELHYERQGGKPEITQTIIRARGVQRSHDEDAMRMTLEAITGGKDIELRYIHSDYGVIWADVYVDGVELIEVISSMEE
jgi:hypothetical protein